MAKATLTKDKSKDAAVKTVEDLQKELVAKQQDLIAAKRSHKAGELVNPKVLATTRKDIARLMTQINALKETK